ncbi:MAG: transglutaminase domain-containing protein [Erysipelotrichales bacterium]|nr:transglutaminase domain-containing protein [Erysipelotrichales bacterium]
MRQLKYLLLASVLVTCACSSNTSNMETPIEDSDTVIDETPEPVVDECADIYMNKDGTVTVEYELDENEEYSIWVIPADEAGNFNLGKSIHAFNDDKVIISLFENNDYKIQIRKLYLRASDGSTIDDIEKSCIVTRNVDTIDTNSYFLLSTASINWENSDAAIVKAKELVANAKDDYDKVFAIWSYIKNNYIYDEDKANGIYTEGKKSLQTIDYTYNTQSGVCMDLTILQAAMLRSVGIPCKLVNGFLNNEDGTVAGAHAWNEVLIDDEWKIIDVTNDLVSLGASNSEMFRNEKYYKKQGEQ